MERVGHHLPHSRKNTMQIDWLHNPLDSTIADQPHYGHEAGDKALCAISEAIQNSLREYDLCGRWGGEEFLILLPDTPETHAWQVIERIRGNIKEMKLQLRENDIPDLSASLGLTLYRDGETFSDTINRADHALLEAKANGRNRTVCHM